MRTISSRRGSGGKWTVILIAAVILMILAVLFTLAKKDVIHINGISPEPESVANLGKVAYVNAAFPAGTEADAAVSFWTYDLDDKSVLIPDDAISESEYMSGKYEGYVLRNAVMANTILTSGMLCPVDTDNLYDDTTREVTISYIDVPSIVQQGDYIDVRIRISSTELQTALSDEIVLAKKEVILREGTTITLRLNEQEQLLLAAATIEKNITPSLSTGEDDFHKAAAIYATKYVSVAQPAAEATYANDTMVSFVRDNWNFVNIQDVRAGVMTTDELGALVDTESAVPEASGAQG